MSYMRRLNGWNARHGALYSIYRRFGGAAARGRIGGSPNPGASWGTLQQPFYRGLAKASKPLSGRPGGFLRVPGRFGGQSAGWGAA